MTMTRNPSKWACRMAPVLTAFVYASLLLGFHSAEAGSGNSSQEPTTSGYNHNQQQQQQQQQPPPEKSLVERLSLGPAGITDLDKLLFCVFILMVIELLTYISTNWNRLFPSTKQIPVRGKHLDVLSTKDLTFLGMNKMATGPFLYFYVRYAYGEPNQIWDIHAMTWKNVLLPLPVLYIVYDFVYTIMHWALHIKAVYGYIHKHHHHQKAPSRGNQDAINVHPVEFFLGEYNHLLALFISSHILDLQIHIVCTLLFVSIGGICAGLNHTRHDVSITVWGVTLFDSKAHDVHHRIPQSNYGQYIMFWDYIFGTFRPYNPQDRVNPSAQLDPQTGKTLGYVEQQQQQQQNKKVSVAKEE